MNTSLNHGSNAVALDEKTYWQLLSDDPFRIFFPLAALVGLAAVLLWPLFYTELISFYPGIVHVRMMISGFMGGYIFGFLATALPRMLEIPGFKKTLLVLMILFWFSAQLFYLFNKLRLGDVLMFVFLLQFLSVILRNFSKRKGELPCTFVLVALGVFSGIAGSFILMLFDFGFGITSEWYLLGMRLFSHSFILLMILGASPFVFRKIMPGAASLYAYLSGGSMPSSGYRMMRAFICGCLLLGSLLMESLGWVDGGRLLMFIVLSYYIFVEVPVCPKKGGANTLAHALQLAVLALVLSSLGMLLDPLHTLAWKHVMFMGSFSYITMVVAVHVMNAHSGRRHYSASTLVFFRWVSAFIWIAIITRVVGEYLPGIYISHIVYASIFWSMAMCLWGWHVLPRALIGDSNDL